jgi:tetratricopeptide (TPR) repeat protein
MTKLFFFWVLLLFSGASALSQSVIESLALKQDWPGVQSYVRAEQTSETTVEDRMLLSHALLAANDVNSAFCGFSAASTAVDLDAWELWTSALERKASDLTSAHYLHGDALARLGRYDAAIAEFDRSLSIDSKSVLARNARGVAFVAAGRYKEAFVDFADVSLAVPEFADAFINRGYLYVLQSGSAASQLKTFNQALAIRSDSTFALIGAGHAVSASGWLFAGVDEVDLALRSCPALDSLLLADRQTLLAWVKSRGERSVAGNAADPDTELKSELGKFYLHPTERGVVSAYHAAQNAAARGDTHAMSEFHAAMNGYLNSPGDPRAKAEVSAGLRDLKGQNQSRILALESQPDSRQMTTGLHATGVGLIPGKGVVKAGVDRVITETKDLQAARTHQIEQAKSEQSFLHSFHDDSGGAETFQLGQARMDLGDAPKPWHNTLMYPLSQHPSKGGK